MIQYNPNDATSIIAYAKGLLKKSLRELVDTSIINKIGESSSSKGKYGNLIEEYYFGYKPNSKAEPDFVNAGLELKTSPLKQLKKGQIVAKERLVLNKIDYMKIIDEEWEHSSFIKKNLHLLLIFYLYQEDKSFWDYIIKIVDKRSLPDNDLQIIQQDRNTIKNKVGKGLAHEISEGDTFYLGACTKAKNNQDITKQPKSSIMAKPRAFSFKPSYVNLIINQLLSKKDNNEKLILDGDDRLHSIRFDTYIIDKFKNYINKSPEDIATSLGFTLNTLPKNYLVLLVKKILGVKTQKIEEFIKANITMKVLRVQSNGMPREAISFPAFKYKEIVNENWDDSSILSMFDKKFFFVIFQEDNGGKLTLKKTIFWNMPYNDLHHDVKELFEETQKRIREFNTKNLPKSKETRVAHIRPHAKNKADTYETLDGKQDTKKCFWLNRKYIAEQIK